jgi:hypothetical protein
LHFWVVLHAQHSVSYFRTPEANPNSISGSRKKLPFFYKQRPKIEFMVFNGCMEFFFEDQRALWVLGVVIFGIRENPWPHHDVQQAYKQEKNGDLRDGNFFLHTDVAQGIDEVKTRSHVGVEVSGQALAHCSGGESNLLFALKCCLDSGTDKNKKR